MCLVGRRWGRLSVLIPARNEGLRIGETVRRVLASRDVDFELVVLDDHSTDDTRAVLARFDDGRLIVETAPLLPPGWNGKQHACACLARLARHDLLVFLDADVRLECDDALTRIVALAEREPGFGLLSGFPRQVTQTWCERLLLPLIHFMLLGFLPIAVSRRRPDPALGAGCGQLMVARRAAYLRAGGHAVIRASRHDGLMLPRAFRRVGIMTGLFDASPLAACRMYETAAEVWEGLTKNATEGMATRRALPVWTAILGLGQVAPLGWAVLAPSPAAFVALGCGYATRALLAWRFRASVLGVVLHPLGVVGLLAVQWAALTRTARGRPSTWRGRAYPAG